jgi:hypothetical protein
MPINFKGLGGGSSGGVDPGSGLPFVSLRSKGGDPTGVTSSLSALAAAKTTLASLGGGIIDMEPGTFVFPDSSVDIGSSNRLRGAGPATTVKGLLATNSLLFINGQQNFDLLDFVVDGSGIIQPLYLVDCHDFSLRRLTMLNTPALAITLLRCSNYEIEDIRGVWPSNTNTPPTLITETNCRNGKIIRPKISGHIGSGISQVSCSDQSIIDPDIDGQWFVLPARFANSGGTVTYPSGTTLTDSSQPFTGANPAIGNGTTLRSMPTRVAAQPATTYDTNLITANAATFISSGVLEGDIIIAGAVWTTAEQVLSEIVVKIDGWRNRSDNLPGATPVAGNFVIYRTLIASIASITGTTITHTGFRDLNGAAITPSAGTLYEVSFNHGAHALFADTSCLRTKVRGGRLRRSWGDICNLQGNFTEITGVTVEYGNDIGIGIEGGSGSSVSGCTTRKNGSMGIWAPDDCDVLGNVCIDDGWQNADVNLGTITLVGSRGTASSNRLVRQTTVLAKYPISIRATTVGGAIGNQVGHNLATGFSTTLIALHSATGPVTNTEVADLTDVTNVTAGGGAITGTIQKPASSVTSPPSIITANNAAWPIPAGATYLEITAVGGGGGGGGGGSAATNATNQVGGGGGGSGGSVQQVVAVGANTTLAILIGAGGAGGTGGAAGGNAASGGGPGGSTFITATGISIAAAGGNPGANSGATSTALVGGGFPAAAGGGVSTVTSVPGQGGPSTFGGAGGNGSAAGGGGGGGPATSTNGGGGGVAGKISGTAAAGGSGASGTLAGVIGGSAVANSGGGGGGGGGGAGSTGAGGNGGTGGSGVVIIRVVG